MHDDGTFRETVDSQQGTALNAGKAFAIAAELYPKIADDSGALDNAAALLEAIGALASAAKGKEGQSMWFSGSDKLAATSSAIAGASALARAAGEDLDLTSEQVTAFAQYFISADTTDIFDNANAREGIRALAPHGAISITATNTVIPFGVQGSKATVDVAVSDLFGVPTDGSDASIVVESVTNESGDKIIEDETLVGGAFKFGKHNPGPGAYDVKVRAGTSTASFLVKVVTSAEFTTATIAVGRSTSYSAEHPRVIKEMAKADSSQRLRVSFGLQTATSEPVTPHQAFVRFRHFDTQLDTYYVASPNDDGLLVASLDLNAEAETLLGRSGVYDLEVFVGGPLLKAGLRWEIGSVELTLPAQTKEDLPLYHQPLLHESDTTLKALPAITHEFRQPEARPGAFFSSMFTLVIVALLAVFVLVALVSPVSNFSAFPSGAGFLSAVLFHGALGLILFLMTLYWFSITMFDLLPMLLPVTLFTIVVGHRNLRNLAAERTALQKQD